MELIRTSVICCALARAWGALAAAWRSSALCRGLTAFFDDILLRWASGSVICNEAPDDEAEEACKGLGKKLAAI